MGLITVKTSHYEADLLVLKSKLESEGIKCYMRNEFTTQIMNYLPSFEVELQVSELDVERVQKILSEMDNNG